MLYLATQFKCVDFLSLLAQSLIHATQMVAHHTKLVFVAPLSRSQLILYDRNQCYNICWQDADCLYLDRKLFDSYSHFTCKRVIF